MDVSGIRAKKRERLEKSEEDSLNRRAKNAGILSRKMNGMGFRSWPDRMFLISAAISYDKRPHAVFIEMKRKGKKLTENQETMIEWLRKAGFEAAWFDNGDDAWIWLRQFLR